MLKNIFGCGAEEEPFNINPKSSKLLELEKKVQTKTGGYEVANPFDLAFNGTEVAHAQIVVKDTSGDPVGDFQMIGIGADGKYVIQVDNIQIAVPPGNTRGFVQE